MTIVKIYILQRTFRTQVVRVIFVRRKEGQGRSIQTKEGHSNNEDKKY